MLDNLSGSSMEKMRVMILVLVDIPFSVLCSIIIGDTLLIPILASLFVFTEFLDVSSLLVSMIILRFLYINLIYGFTDNQLFLTLFIAYVEVSLPSNRTYMCVLYTFLLILVVVLADNSKIPCTIDSDSNIFLNTVTRLYIETFIFIQTISFKYRTVKREEELAVEALTLDELEYEEIKFTKRFSHFSRTSLNAIVNFLHFLRRNLHGLFLKRLENHFDVIEDSCQEIVLHSVDLVEFLVSRRKKFVDFSDMRINLVGSTKSSSSVISSVDIRKVLNYVFKVQKRVRLGTNNEKVSLEKFVSPSVPMKIRIERIKLSKILTNVVSNSIKYTKIGKIKVLLRCVCDPKVETLVKDEETRILIIECEDTGVGIKKEILDNIFKPFWKDKGDIQDSFSVGLTIVKSILDKLNGKIEIHSKGENMGTKTTVSIPVSIPKISQIKCRKDVDPQPSRVDSPHRFSPRRKSFRENEQEQEQFEEEEEVETSCSASLRHKGKKPKRCRNILIVEDNVISQQVFKRQIEMIDWRLKVHIAKNGQEALSLLQRKRNRLIRKDTLILSDIDMPVMNGFQFVRLLRNRFGNRLVVYSLTATVVSSVEEFKARGFDDVRVKPITLDGMRSTVHEMIKKRSEKMDTFPKISKKENLDEVTTEKEMLEEEEEEELYMKSDNRRSVIFRKVDSCLDGKIFLVELGVAFLRLLVFSAVYFLLPEEHQNGYRLFVLTFLVLIVAGFTFTLFFSYSMETLATFSVLRSLISAVIASEFSFFKKLSIVFTTETAEIVQASQTIQSFTTSFMVSLVVYLQIIYYELTRGNEHHFSVYEEPFYFKCYQVSLYLFMLVVVSLVFTIRSSTKEKKKSLEGILEEKKEIENEINLAMAKISHDPATPQTAAILFIEDLGCILKSNGAFNTGALGKKIFRCFRFMVLSSITLECSIQNFLICCKVRNKKYISFMKDKVNIKTVVSSVVKRVSILKPPDTTLKLCVIHNEAAIDVIEKQSVLIDLWGVNLILLNLIINAYIHSKSKNVSIELDVLERQEEEEKRSFVVIVIKDDGVGLGEKLLETLPTTVTEFRFRERFSNTLGLGLMVCRFLASIAGGEINFSTGGGGTTIRLVFPFSYCEEEGEEEEEEEVEGEDCIDNMEKKYRKLPCFPSWAKKDKFTRRTARVLVVDDNMNIVFFLRKLMEDVFHFSSVTSTASEDEVIELLETGQQFDIMLTDFNLTSMTSVELLCSKIRPERKPKVVVVITGSTFQDVLRNGREVVDDILMKPIQPMNVRSCLEKFVIDL